MQRTGAKNVFDRFDPKTTTRAIFWLKTKITIGAKGAMDPAVACD
jgi:hypothetical protein